MGLVIDIIECPNCGREAHIDFYYKTGEEYIRCTDCGYYRDVLLKNRNKKMSEITEKDYHITEIKNPYGAFRIERLEIIDGGSRSLSTILGSLEDETNFIKFKNESLNKYDCVERIIVTKLIDGKIVKIYEYDRTKFAHFFQ